MSNLIRLSLLIISWVSIIFLPKKSLKKYLPITMFTSILTAGICVLATPYKWWIVEGGWKNKIFNMVSFVLGPFFVGTLWVFHFTFGQFYRYFVLNVVMDLMFSFPLNYFFQKAKLYKLVNFKPKHIFFTFISFSFIIYWYENFLNRFKCS